MKPKKKQSRRWARNACLGLIGMLSLVACAHSPAPVVLTKVQVEHVTVPAALLSVDAEPVVPVGRMQSAAADYMVRLKINDDECHLDVGAIAVTQQ
jgi:hypothetical protein